MFADEYTGRFILLIAEFNKVSANISRFYLKISAIFYKFDFHIRAL